MFFINRLIVKLFHTVTFALFLTCCFTIQTQAGERSMIIGFHEQPDLLEESLVHGKGGKIKRKFQNIPAYAADLSDKAVKHLRKDPRVKYVVEDSWYWVVEPLQMADPLEYQNSWGVAHIGSMTAHANNINGKNVRVAVLDTGIDYKHQDLAKNYQGGIDFVFNDNDPYDDSWNSHGTHVAGIIAAAANGSGVVGVAPKAKLYGVKVLDGGGFGLLSWIIAGIDWAISKNIDIINISIGGSHSSALQDACDKAYEDGVLLVAAAGSKSGIKYPAAYDSVIAVTGTDMADQDQQYWFAPTGPQIELAAPGVFVNSTSANNDFKELSGTSQAAPHVSGVAALIYSAGTYDLNGDDIINNKDVRIQLQESALDLGDAGKDDVFGYGLVDVPAALEIDRGSTTFDLVRDPQHGNDSKIVELYDMEYQVTISNNSLKEVHVEVYENGIYRGDLYEEFSFAKHMPQEVSFFLDALNTTLEVVFLPLGRPGSSAGITIIDK